MKKMNKSSAVKIPEIIEAKSNINVKRFRSVLLSVSLIRSTFIKNINAEIKSSVQEKELIEKHLFMPRVLIQLNAISIEKSGVA